MSLLDRDEVPAPKSRASTRPTDSPRVAASSATPAPTTPPPTTSTWNSAPASAASAADLASGSSLAAPAPPAPTGRTLALTSASRLRAGCDHYLHPLEFLEVRVTGGGHGAPERAHQVQHSVGDGGRAVQDLLQGADGADGHPRPPGEVGVMRLAPPVVAAAGCLLGAGERRAGHHRVRPARERLGQVAAAGHPAVRDHVHVPAAGLVEVLTPGGGHVGDGGGHRHRDPEHRGGRVPRPAT